MRIKFHPTPKQYEAWQYLSDQTTSQLGYGGGGHGGKTWLGSFWIASMCEAFPNTAWLIGRRELKNLKRTTLLTFFKMAETYGWHQGKHFSYSPIESIIQWHNGSVIFLMDLAHMPSDPLFLRLGGLELTGGWIDESNEVSWKAIDILLTRLGRRMNDQYKLKPKLLETFNPDKRHVFSRFYKPWKEGKLPEFRKFIQALPSDNPYTTEDYINQLKNSDKVTQQRLLYGNFEYDDDPSCLFDFDSIQDLFTNKAEKSDQRFLSVDVARKGKDSTKIGLWHGLQLMKVWTFNKRPITGEGHVKKSIQQELEQIAANNQVRRSNIVVDEDGVGGGLVDSMAGVKGFVNNSKAIKPSGKKDIPNYANLKTQCYFEFARLASDGRIGIESLSPEDRDALIEELEQIKQANIDKDGKITLIGKDKIKEAIGRSPDIADMMMMRMFFELKRVELLIPHFVN